MNYLFFILCFSTTLGISSPIYSQCEWNSLEFDGFEHTNVDPSFIVSSCYTSGSPSNSAIHNGGYGLYMNFQNGFSGLVYDRTFTIPFPCPGLEYRFNYWVKDAWGDWNDITVNVYDAGGNLLATQQTTTNGTWANITTPSFIPPTATVTFQLVTNRAGQSGNDLAFDDLTFEMCTPVNSAQSSLCATASSIDLYNSLISPDGTSGTWSGPSTLTGAHLGTFDPATSTEGTYTYTENCAINYVDVSLANIDVDVSATPTTPCGASTFQLEAEVPIAPCEYTITLYDSFGDGWTGNTIQVLLDGVNVGTYELSDFGPSSGYGPETFTIPVTDGAVVTTVFSGNSWPYENEYIIYDQNGVELFSEGQGGVTPAGGSVGTVDCPQPVFNYNYSWTPSTDLTADNISNPIASPASTTTYTVTATDAASGCTTSNTVTVTPTPSSSIDLGNDTTICPGASLTLDAGVGFDSYLWNDGSTDQTLTVNSAGDYSVEATNMGDNVIANGDFETGNVGFNTEYALGAGGGWGPISNEGTYFITNNTSTAHTNFTSCPDHSGSGNMMVINGSGVAGLDTWCQTIEVVPNTDYEFSTWIWNFSITEPAELSFSINGVQLGANFSPTSGGSCTWENFFETWNSGTNTSITICIENQNTGTSGNDFALDDITFAPICTYSDEITVSIQNPTVTVNNETICYGDDVDLNASGATTYDWSPAVTLSSSSGSTVTANPTTTTTYTITGTDPGGCTGTADAVVTVLPQILPDFTNSGTYCDNDNAVDFTNTSSNVSGNETYSWVFTNGTPSSSNLTNPTGISWTTAGTYDVTLTVTDDACEESSTSSVTIIECPVGAIQILTSSTNVSCNGDCDGSIDATISGGDLPYTYLWTDDNGSNYNTEDLSNLCPGTYDLLITDLNGLTSATSVIISELQLMSVIIDNTSDVICNGDCNGTADISIDGGTAPYSVAWSSLTGYASSNEDISSLCPDQYDVVVTDENNCTSNASVLISEPLALSVTATQVSANCGQADGVINAVASGGNTSSNYTYLVEDGTGNTIGNTASALGLLSGNYDITVSDIDNCSSQTSIIVTDISGGNASTQIESPISCFGVCDGEVSVSMVGGTAPYSYSWSSGGSAAIETNLCAGNWDVTITDNVGCVTVSSINITEPTEVIGNISANPEVCINDCEGSINLLSVGGTGPYTYSIDNGINYTSTNNFAQLCSGDYPVVIQDANGCTFSSNANVLPGTHYDDASINPIDDLCADASSIQLTSASSGGVWEGNGVIGSFFDPQLSGVGTHTIEYRTISNCPDTANLEIIVNPLPNIEFAANIQAGCAPLAVAFNNIGDLGVACQWNFGNQDISTDCFSAITTYNSPGTYDVSLTTTDINGCSNSITEISFIEVYENPIAEFTSDPQPASILNPLITFTDQSTDAVEWTWIIADMDTLFGRDPSYDFANVGTYDVELIVTSIYGCEDSITYPVTIDDNFVFFLPNSFTPNSDGINDILIPVLQGEDPESYEFSIFNRWGELIFNTSDSSEGWDGNYLASIAKSDVYVWKIRVKDITSNEKKDYFGHINLLR